MEQSEGEQRTAGGEQSEGAEGQSNGAGERDESRGEKPKGKHRLSGLTLTLPREPAPTAEKNPRGNTSCFLNSLSTLSPEQWFGNYLPMVIHTERSISA